MTEQLLSAFVGILCGFSIVGIFKILQTWFDSYIFSKIDHELSDRLSGYRKDIDKLRELYIDTEMRYGKLKMKMENADVDE